MATPLVDFYAGTATDSNGRSLADIHGWTFDRLEEVHDYIQWLFPLRVASAFQPNTPVLDDEQIAAFQASSELQARLKTSLDVMLHFYGFRRSGLLVTRSLDWKGRSKNWLTHGNHNHLRLTRILTSLSLLGLTQEARALQRALLAEYELSSGAISAATKRFWENALD